MTRFLILFWILPCLLISGCATIKPVTVNSGDTFAVASRVNSEFRHIYVGITIFNNEYGRFQTGWPIPETIRDTLNQHSNFTLQHHIPSSRSNLFDWARKENVHYLIRIENGRVCLVGDCSLNHEGIGTFGQVVAGRYVSVALQYSILDIRNDQVVYSRRINNVASIPRSHITTDNGSNVQEFQSTVLCLLRENLLSAMTDMNQVAPLFQLSGSGFSEKDLALRFENNHCLVDHPRYASFEKHIQELEKNRLYAACQKRKNGTRSGNPQNARLKVHDEEGQQECD